MKTSLKIIAIASGGWLACLPVWADTCATLRSQMVTSGPAVETWAGVENEVRVTEASLEERNQLLESARTNDAANLNFWTGYAAPTESSDRFEVTLLESAGIGRVERYVTDTGVFSGYFRKTPAGGVAAVAAPPGPTEPQHVAFRPYVRAQLLSFGGQVLNVVTVASNHGYDDVRVASWNGVSFRFECAIRREYCYRFAAVPDKLVSAAKPDDGLNAFIAANANAWADDNLVWQRQRLLRTYPGSGNRNKFHADMDARDRTQRVDAFIAANRELKARVKALDAELDDDYMLVLSDEAPYVFPALYNNKPVMVLVQHDSENGDTLPNLYILVYGTKDDGRFGLLGVANTRRSGGELTALTIFPPCSGEPSRDRETRCAGVGRN